VSHDVRHNERHRVPAECCDSVLAGSDGAGALPGLSPRLRGGVPARRDHSGALWRILRRCPKVVPAHMPGMSALERAPETLRGDRTRRADRTRRLEWLATLRKEQTLIDAAAVGLAVPCRRCEQRVDRVNPLGRVGARMSIRARSRLRSVATIAAKDEPGALCTGATCHPLETGGEWGSCRSPLRPEGDVLLLPTAVHHHPGAVRAGGYGRIS
jgi:hypothetical protein